jgi:lipid-A-disaccharide synthase
LPNQAPQPRALLFTAFEPSGDDHASSVIAQLREQDPSITIFAYGGPKMHRAGAHVLERTGDDAVMGLPGAAKVVSHLRLNTRIARWMDDNRRGPSPIAAHIPVDSPAANWSICALAKQRGVRVVHLVAPQIWAWGSWRIRKMRRLSDHVLCILPFEEKYFRDRGVQADFVGHFLFDDALDLTELDRRASSFGDGHPRIAIMPGSRPDELRRHFPILLDAFHDLLAQFPSAVGVVAATSETVARGLSAQGQTHDRGWPPALRIVTQDTDAVVRWCDIALVKSGTVTLQVAKQAKPMVVFYKKSNPLIYQIARTALMNVESFSLPNILAGRRIVPELIPHYGGAEPIVRIAQRLISDAGEREQQVDAIRAVLRTFEGKQASVVAARRIRELCGWTATADPQDSGAA